MMPSKPAKKAFTLIELLVVIVIIGLLASLVAPKFFGKLDDAKIKTTKAQMELISTALDTFKLDVGRYPTSKEGLKILWSKPENVKNWNGKYLPKPIQGDAWGNPYIYKNPGANGEEYDLISWGADAQEGGEEDNKDISIWQ
jgi:general secretion pathway protein G